MAITTAEPAVRAELHGFEWLAHLEKAGGKTAAFGLPLLDAVDAHDSEVQALVLAPTRELAMQSAAAIEDFLDRHRL